MDHLLNEIVRLNSDPVIIHAWEFANLAHTGQSRRSGEPYINHPTQVALTLAKWGLDTDAIVAGLLHDTVEDGGATHADLVTQFGQSVAEIVEGVTKITDIEFKGSADEIFVENLRKMLLLMAKDLRVVLVRLADRLHNMQTLSALSARRQLANAKETLEIYAPLAGRLGMGEIKGQLEDLSFPYVFPEAYKDLLSSTKSLYAKSHAQIEKIRRHLLTALSHDLPKSNINIRQKHLYSLYKKLLRPEIAGDLSKIHDLVAARILVDTEAECYIALGIVHGLYRPVPYLGVSDFIANPKPNGYRSLHTKVFSPEGNFIEIQIRTRTMHEEAEMGVAAHWHYSEAKSKGVSSQSTERGYFAPKDKLSWVKQLMNWQQEIKSNSDYLNLLKLDAFQNRLLVFSPAGDVFDLPTGSTPVDFAYAVHTGLGHSAAGAKVNGKLVTLDHPLSSGDVVEIVPGKNQAHPSVKWLDFVVSAAARHAIQKSIRS